MKFSDRMKKLRQEKGITQEQLAKALGTTTRTVQNYELGQCYPRKQEMVKKIAEYFEISTEALISGKDIYILEATEKGGVASGRTVEALLSDIDGLFAGGELSEEDKDKVMKTIHDLYWKAKEKNKKYASHKETMVGDDA